jgi:hypothetical protein
MEGFRVVSAADPYGPNLGFIDQKGILYLLFINFAKRVNKLREKYL